MSPRVRSFFHAPSGTLTYLVADPASKAAAVIDPVLDYDGARGAANGSSAIEIVEAIRADGLDLQWIWETHVHADHLSASWFMKEQTGARIGIGAGLRAVIENLRETVGEPASDGFDHLFEDGEELTVGTLRAHVMATPGHTPSCVTYVFEGAAFVGDALFMPDVGTGRCDFPGGSPHELFRSAQRILGLPDGTRLYSAHDYPPPPRAEPACGATVAEQRRCNLHLGDGRSEAEFADFRSARDATLPLPALFEPSLRMNIGGRRQPLDGAMRFRSSGRCA